MKTWQTKLKGIGAAALMLCAFAWTGASAQIANTKHNLGSTGTGNSFSGTAEICVFCHTPHGADTSVQAPLWNRAAGTGPYSTYSTTNSTTIDGAVASVGSVSIACLSCHDGTQSMDSVINQPGSGADVSGTGRMGTDAQWTSLSGLIPDTVARLGTDLTNDHPIGVEYGGGGVTSTNFTGNDPDFKAANHGTINSTSVWWVDTETNGNNTREKTDMILYASAGRLSGGPSVECASCHDPHTTNQTFLRIANTGSAVCLACHTK